MAELTEDDLEPGEVSPDELEPTEASDTTTVSPDGVVKRSLVKVAPDLSLPDSDPEVIAAAKGAGVAAPNAKPEGFVEKLGQKLSKGADLVREAMSPKTETGAFGLGTVSGTTLGFGDELIGLLEAADKMDAERQKVVDDVAEAKRTGTYGPVAPKVPELVSYQLKREGQPEQAVVRAATSPDTDEEAAQSTPWRKAYEGARDSMREQFHTAAREQPVAFGAGEFAGALATPAPGPGKARGLAKVGKYALQGAGIGTAAGLGNSEADDVGGMLLDTGAGTIGGGVAGGVMGGVAAKLDPYLEQQAARRAYKALDPYMETIKSGLQAKLGRNPAPREVMAEVERLGRRALEEGVIPEGKLARWANSETLGNRADELLEEAGMRKGGFVDMAQDALGGQPVSLGKLASNIEAEAQAARLRGQQSLARQLEKEAADLRQTIVDRASAGFADPAAQTLPEAEAMKTLIQREVFGAGRPGGSKQAAKEAVARLAKEQAENVIESGLGPEELAQFQALKGRYGDLATIQKTASHGALRDFRNQVLGLGDKSAAAAGGAAAGIPGAAIAGGASNFFRRRGDAGLARTLSNAAKSNELLTPASQLEPWMQFLAEDDPEATR